PGRPGRSAGLTLPWPVWVGDLASEHRSTRPLRAAGVARTGRELAMALQAGPPGQLIAIGVGDLLVVVLAAAVLVAVAVFVGVVLSRRSRTSERDLQQDLHEQRQD